jgi:hypothetical protein
LMISLHLCVSSFFFLFVPPLGLSTFDKDTWFHCYFHRYFHLSHFLKDDTSVFQVPWPWDRFLARTKK